MNKEYLDYDGLKRYNENLMEIIRGLASGPLPVYWEKGTWPGVRFSYKSVAKGYYWSDGIFATGVGYKLFQSTNGVTWSEVTVFENADQFMWISVFNCNDRPFVWGYNSDTTTLTGAMKYRNDWTVINTKFEEDQIVAMAYGVGKYFAYSSHGDIFTSEDGITWASTGKKISDSFNESIARTVYGAGGGFVAIISSDTVARSEDGINWETFTPNVPLDYYQCLEYISGRYYLGGLGGIISSENGHEWHSVLKNNSSGISVDILSIAYANNKWLVIGYGEYAYSLDGQKTWYWHTSSTLDFSHADRSFIMYINDRFVYLNSLSTGYTQG